MPSGPISDISRKPGHGLLRACATIPLAFEAWRAATPTSIAKEGRCVLTQIRAVGNKSSMGLKVTSSDEGAQERAAAQPTHHLKYERGGQVPWGKTGLRRCPTPGLTCMDPPNPACPAGGHLVPRAELTIGQHFPVRPRPPDAPRPRGAPRNAAPYRSRSVLA